MTGRDVIMFILQNHLEDVEIPGFVTVEEAAVKMHVGVESIKLLYQMKELQGIEIGDKIYIFMQE